jgi:hypothetical protein
VVNFLYLANVRCRRLARVAPNEGPLPHGVDISVRRDGMRVYEVWDPIDPDTAERYDFRNDRIIKPE